MNQRVLLCTIGGTPQVVTETVWALQEKRDPPWIPDAIHVVTTSFALDRIRSGLQAPGGQLAQLMQTTAPPVTIHLPRKNGESFTIHPTDEDGVAAPLELPSDLLADVHSESEAVHMGELIRSLVDRFTADEEAELHVSLAGGRKTMSAHALIALSLLGRVGDAASHVLVSPQAFEDNHAFWYPGQAGGKISPRPAPGMRSAEPELIDPAEADVMLVPVPTPFVRYMVKDPQTLTELRLEDLVATLNLAQNLEQNPDIVLDTARNIIRVCGVERRLSPKLFAIYRLFAAAVVEQWPGTGPFGYGPKHFGWLSTQQICVGKTGEDRPIARVLRRYLKEAIAANGGDPDGDGMVASWQAVIIETSPRLRLDLAQNFLGSFSRLFEGLDEAFPPAVAQKLKPGRETKRIAALRGNDPIPTENVTRLGLLLPPEAIRIC